MGKGTDSLTDAEINVLCDATSAVYYAIVASHSRKMGTRPMLPEHLCPKGEPACPCNFTEEQLDEAEAFLVRLGMIAAAEE